MSNAWRDCLFRLHASGWNADDIDEACEALSEACSEGVYEGTAVRDLTTDQIQAALRAEVPAPQLDALRVVAALREQQNAEAEQLRQALYDLDAFAYEFSGDS